MSAICISLWLLLVASCQGLYNPSSSSLPISPEGLTCASAADGTSIGLSWSSVEKVTSYCVYRADSGSGTFKKLATVTVTSYTDSTTAPGSSYSYALSSVNSAGEGVKGTAVAATATKPLELPSPPEGLECAIGEDKASVILSWKAVDTATSYKLYRADTENGSYAILATVTGSAGYADSSAKAGSNYWYKVSALNAKGESALSAAIMSGPLPSPAGLAVSSGSDGKTATVSWEEATGALSYAVYRAQLETGSYAKLGTIGGTSYSDAGLEPGSVYWYKVSAISACGEGLVSAPVSGLMSDPSIALPTAAGVFSQSGNAGCNYRFVFKADGSYEWYDRIASTTPWRDGSYAYDASANSLTLNFDSSIEGYSYIFTTSPAFLSGFDGRLRTKAFMLGSGAKAGSIVGTYSAKETQLCYYNKTKYNSGTNYVYTWKFLADGTFAYIWCDWYRDENGNSGSGYIHEDLKGTWTQDTATGVITMTPSDSTKYGSAFTTKPHWIVIGSDTYMTLSHEDFSLTGK